MLWYRAGGDVPIPTQHDCDDGGSYDDRLVGSGAGSAITMSGVMTLSSSNMPRISRSRFKR